MFMHFRLGSGLEHVKPIVVATVLVVAAPGMLPTAAQEREPQSGANADRRIFIVDVAEDLTRFNPTFVKPTDTQPERGSFFVTEGNIFPYGTIQGDGASFDPNSEGAIGRWLCRGTHLVSASDIPAAPIWVNTTQLYVLPRKSGGQAQGGDSIVTEGLEGSGMLVRAVAGGAGVYRDYVGEQRQEFLGFNATGGVNLRVTFVLKKAARH
jgi:hypothetical protein